jgi:mannonate dehydratase
MFGVMRELVRQKYPRALYPEHPRAIDLDRAQGIKSQYPGGGGFAGEIYNVGYARAMLQAALTL